MLLETSQANELLAKKKIAPSGRGEQGLKLKGRSTIECQQLKLPISNL